MFLSVIKLLSFRDFGSSIKFLILEGSIFCTKAKILSLSTPLSFKIFKAGDSINDIDFTGE